MALTAKELSLLSDNIKMSKNSINFMKGCAGMCSDPQVSALCTQIADDRTKDVATLMQHINKMANQRTECGMELWIEATNLGDVRVQVEVNALKEKEKNYDE